MIEVKDIYTARQRIAPLVCRTPLEYSQPLSELTGANVYLKLEMMRETRAFKIRGAVNCMAAIPEADRSRGVVAASGGSHAQGVAFAANRLGIPATIVMTERSSQNLRDICRGYGAEVIVKGAIFNDANAVAEEISRETGRPLIHSFEDPLIIAGQDTIGLEIAEDLPNVDAVIVPVGGGGLLGGVGCAIKTLCPGAQVIGVEPEQVASMTEAMRVGRPVTVENPRSLADKLVVQTVGDLTLRVSQRYTDEMINVSEAEIAESLYTMLHTINLLTEGAASASLAALRRLEDRLRGKNVALILTGGNIDAQILTRVLAEQIASA